MIELTARLRELLVKAREDDDGRMTIVLPQSNGAITNYLTALMEDAPTLLDEIDRLTGEVERLETDRNDWKETAEDVRQEYHEGHKFWRERNRTLKAKAVALAEAMQEIKQWAEAYPKDVFPEPDLKLADKVLKDAGISMTGMNGTFARHLMKGVGKIADTALTAFRGGDDG